MEFQFENQQLKACQEEFNKLDPEKALFYTHYQFAKVTPITDAGVWKKFLTDPRVAEWLTSEVETIRQVKLRKMINQATDNEKSVGAAQMINALDKVSASTQQKDGAVFVYCYTPLNEREQTAPNVRLGGK